MSWTLVLGLIAAVLFMGFGIPAIITAQHLKKLQTIVKPGRHLKLYKKTMSVFEPMVFTDEYLVLDVKDWWVRVCKPGGFDAKEIDLGGVYLSDGGRCEIYDGDEMVGIISNNSVVITSTPEKLATRNCA
jgi:hypothetical protein